MVKEVLDDPLCLIRGWDRPEKDECFVYVGRPNHDFQSLTIEKPPPPGKLFLIFVLPDGTIEHWNWRTESDDKGVPEGLRGEIAWTRPN